jgi:hypothetical protein
VQDVLQAIAAIVLDRAQAYISNARLAIEPVVPRVVPVTPKSDSC